MSDKRPAHGLSHVSNPDKLSRIFVCTCGEMFITERKMKKHLRDEGFLKRGELLKHWSALG